MVNLTGLGVALSSLIVSMAGSSIWLIALVTALVCLVLGMGIPTTAAYVLVAAVLAPALIKVGIEPIIAHMFVFYYATISVITPPVCVAVFVAAGIAQTNWMAVAREACKLGAVTYVIPFMFIAYPGMLASGSWLDLVEAVVSGTVFTMAFASLFGGARFFPGAVWISRPCCWLPCCRFFPLGTASAWQRRLLRACGSCVAACSRQWPVPDR